MSYSFTRQELYDLIWSEPVSVVAKRLGISDVWLRKNCIAADIPLPPAGFWAKKRAGKATRKIDLPQRGLGQFDVIEIGRRPHYWYPQDADVEQLPPPTVFDESLEEVTRRAQKAIGKAAFRKTLQNPHRLIARLLEEDEQRRQKLLEIPYAWEKPRFEGASALRKLRIVNGLFLALSSAGARPTVQGKDAPEWGVGVGDQHVTFTLEEVGQKKRPRQSPETSKKPGRVELRLEIPHFTDSGGPSYVWQDSDEETVEQQSRHIAVSLLVAGEMQYRSWVERRYQWLVERKQQRDEAERQRLETLERERRKRQLKLEKARRDRLVADAEALTQAASIRRFLGVVAAKASNCQDKGLEERLTAWLNWATAEADRLDPLSRPIEEMIAYLFEADTEP